MTSTYPLNRKTPTQDSITVSMPNGDTIDSTHKGLLPMPEPINMPAHVLPALSHSLISIGKLCDAGCTATFDAKKVIIKHNQDEIIMGKRNSQGLWMLPTQPTNKKVAPTKGTPQVHFSIHDAMVPDIVKFLHLTLYSPTKSTLLTAIRNNHFVGWPGLTERNVQRYLTLQEPTILGHMDQQRQGTRSTHGTRPTQQAIPMQNTTVHTDTDTNEDVLEINTTRTQHVYLSVQDLPTGRVFTDQTGPFPVVSTQGIKAVMVMYDYDSNAILVEGITSRGKTELLRAYTILLQRLQQAGMHPKIQRMDNEVSDIFKTFLQTQNITLELTPAHVHRRNAAERAIRTWKNHFLAGLASLNP